MLGRDLIYGEASDDEIIEQKSSTLYNLITGFHKLTEKMMLNEEQLDKLRRTFEGLFAAIDIVRQVLTIGLKTAFDIINAVLGTFDMDILDLTANIGDAIVSFRNWIKENEFLQNIVNGIAQAIHWVIVNVKDLINWILQFPQVQTAINFIKNLFLNMGSTINNVVNNIKEFINRLNELGGFSLNNIKTVLGEMLDIPADEVGEYLVKGLIEGVKKFATTAINVVMELGRGLIDGIKKVLDIHSPSGEFIEIAKYCILGIVEGIQWFAGLAFDAIKNIGKQGLEAFSDIGINWGGALAAGLGTGLLLIINKLADGILALSAPFEGFGNLLNSCSNAVDTFSTAVSKALNNIGKAVKYEALATLVKSIVLLVAAVGLLAVINPENLWSAVGAVAALGGVLALLAVAIGKSGNIDVKEVAKIALLTASLSGALVSLGIITKILGGIEWPELLRGISGVAVFGIFIKAITKAAKGAGKNIDNVGKMLLKLSGALVVMSIAMKLIGGMEWSSLAKGVIGIGLFSVFINEFVESTKGSRENIDNIGKIIMKLSLSMSLLGIAARIIGGMEWDSFVKGISGVGLMFIFVNSLIKVAKNSNENIQTVSKSILGISAAMSVLSITIGIMGSMEWSTIGKGIVGVAGLEALVVGLIAATKLIGDKQMSKITSQILSMAGAIAAMSITMGILSFLDISDIGKGLVAIAGMGAIVSLMTYVLGKVASVEDNAVKGKGKSFNKTLNSMTVAIVAMSVAVAALSFIDTKKLLTSTAALSVLILSFSVLTKSSKDIEKGSKVLLTLTLAVAVLGGVLTAMSVLKVDNALENAAALSILFLSLSFSMDTLADIADPSKMIKKILLLTAMAIPLSAFIGVLYLMQDSDIDASIKNVALLAILFAESTYMLKELSKIENVGNEYFEGNWFTYCYGSSFSSVYIGFGVNEYFGYTEFNRKCNIVRSISG